MLNTELIRQRRRDLNLTHREVARRLRVTWSVIKRLEEGLNYEWLGLGEVTKLAEILSVDVADMFAEDHDTNSDGEDRTSQVAEVGRMLFEIGKLVPRSSLCTALDCSPDDLDDTLEQLNEALGPVGLTVHESKASVGIEPVAAGASDALQTLIRDQIATRCLTITEANVLARVVSGTVKEWHLNGNENMALQRLRKAGIVETDRDELTPTAAESLMVGG